MHNVCVHTMQPSIVYTPYVLISLCERLTRLLFVIEQRLKEIEMKYDDVARSKKKKNVRTRLPDWYQAQHFYSRIQKFQFDLNTPDHDKAPQRKKISPRFMCLFRLG